MILEAAASNPIFHTNISKLNSKTLFCLTLLYLFKLLIAFYARSNSLLSSNTNKMIDNLVSIISSNSDFSKSTREIDIHNLFRSVGIDLQRNPILITESFYQSEYESYENYLYKPEYLFNLTHLLFLDRNSHCGLKLSEYKTLNCGFPSEIYEHLLSYEPVIENEAFRLKRIKNSPGKLTGSFYTPHEIIKFMVEHTITPLVKDMNGRQISNIKILDPSMGTGLFLNHVIDFLTHKYSKLSECGKDLNEISSIIAQNCIYGIDKDPIAVEFAKIGIIFKAGASDSLTARLERNLKFGDTITGYDFEALNSNSEAKKLSNWELDFKNILQDGFDIVIGNPPWITIRHSELDSETVKYIKRRYRSAGGFKMNIFPLFIERSIELLADNGRLGLIVPNRILDTPSYSECRRLLFDTISIDDIVSVDSGAFKKITASHVIITGFKNGGKTNSQLTIKNFDRSNKKKTIQIPWKLIKKDNLLRVNININPTFIPIAKRIKNNSITLESVFNLHVGMMIKNRDLVLLLERDSLHNEAVITSRDIGICRINSKRYFSESEVEVFGGTKNRLKHTAYPKLVIRKTGDKILAALDNEGIFCEQSLYMAIPKNNMQLAYLKTICLFMNTKIVSEYYRNMLITNPDSFPYIQHYDLARIPIPARIDNSTKYKMSEFYDNLNNTKMDINEVLSKIENPAKSLFGL